MKILISAIVALMLHVAPLSAGEVFKDADWDRVDAVLILMKRDLYVNKLAIVKKSHRRITLTSVETKDTFCWMFDANNKTAYMGHSQDGLYWVMTKVEKILQKAPDATDIIRGQLIVVESVVALVNAQEME